MTKAFAQNFYLRSSLFSILSIVAAAINYALYPILARILNIEEFGDYTTVVALSTQITGILLAFNVISIYLVKNHTEGEAREKAQLIQKIMIWAFSGLAIIVLLLSPLLKDVLKIQHPAAFLALGFILLFSITASIWTGYLQGHKELVRIGTYSLGSAIFRLACVIAFAAIFGGVAGLWGFALGMALGLAVLRLLPGVSLPRVSTLLKGLSNEDKAFLRRFGPYIVQSIFVVGSLCMLQNFDITLAKILFSPDSAGAYSGISILSNALYYILFLLVWIVLPEVDERNTASTRRVMKTSYRVILLLTAAALFVEIVLKDLLVNLLLGESFRHQGNTLIFATLYQSTLVSITLYGFYLLILRGPRSIALTISVLACCLSLPAIFAKTPLQMIVILWLSVLLGTTIYWIVNRYFLSKNRQQA